ncbi:MAG TPA: molybdate ABC transporter substrate-binding protein [Thermoanaerobaculia bacterium]|nr:molybdate ABC transporter substrate-binding protein [Thermoanaerobaculia bacterium]
MKRLALFLLVTLSPAVAFAANVRVSAAASITDVLQEIAPAYEKQTGDGIIFNFGSSSMLARQIQEGAPAGLFISADELKMDQLQQRGLIVKKSRRSILSNTLVIIVPSDSRLKIASAADLADPGIRNVAVAEPQSVPAGIYAKQYLRKLRVWDRITYKVIPTDNVRAALAAVESGNAETGIVYKTDAMISRAVRVVYEVPASEGPDISYPAAVLADSKQQAAAQRFLDYLQSPPAREVFRRYGFILKSGK